jgi:SAM-dependent methyltransferase
MKLIDALRGERDSRVGTPEYTIAYDPGLVPPPSLMQRESVEVLEDWFRWGEEWSVLLRVYAGLGRRSAVLEIGCGLGRTAFPLRYVLLDGTYEGFDVCGYKVDFLREGFHARYPNFRFQHADVHNTAYNPGGSASSATYRFPYADASFDVVFAASVFTHLVPDGAANYFAETARVLRRDGRALFSFFVLDHYEPGRARPLGCARSCMSFDHPYENVDGFAIADPNDPENSTAYRVALIERMAAAAGLQLAEPPLHGMWSGGSDRWIGTQDLVLLERRT